MNATVLTNEVTMNDVNERMLCLCFLVLKPNGTSYRLRYNSRD
jgi:hypothetical protein